jgi:hypothetical protein
MAPIKYCNDDFFFIVIKLNKGEKKGVYNILIIVFKY